MLSTRVRWQFLVRPGHSVVNLLPPMAVEAIASLGEDNLRGLSLGLRLLILIHLNVNVNSDQTWKTTFANEETGITNHHYRKAESFI